MTDTLILQLTDLHLFADPAERLFGIPTRELLQDVLAHVEASGVRPDHVVVTGDHTHDELPQSYEAARGLLDPGSTGSGSSRAITTTGIALRSAFAERIGGEDGDRVQFAFSAGEWLCLGLDTQVPGEVGGRIDAGQVEWIREQMRNRQPEAVVLFTHHPPVDLGLPWLDRIGLEGRSCCTSYSRTMRGSASSAAATSTTSRRTGSARPRS